MIKRMFFPLLILFGLSLSLSVYLLINRNDNLANINRFRSNLISREYNTQLNHDVEIGDIIMLQGSSEFSIKDSIDSEFLLVFRIPETSCNTCVDKIMPDFKEFMGDVDENKYVYLIDNSTANCNQIFTNKYSVPVNTVKTTKYSIDIPYEKTNSVYAFVIDKKMEIRYFFIPSINDNLYNRYIMKFIVSNFLD